MTMNENFKLSAKALKKLENTIIGRRLYFYKDTTSTFDRLSELSEKEGALVVASKQTSGRGRLGRRWSSDIGGIYFSFALPPENADNAPFITLTCALAVQRALSKYIPCEIKWPNDIVSSGKKLCGILTKSTLSNGKIDNILVGIGINANISKFPEELIYASSIKLLTGKDVDENNLLYEVIKELDFFCFNQKRESILENYKKVCANIGKTVTIHYTDSRGDIKGVCSDILSDGTMNVITDDGNTVNVNSGEVSVKGIYESERTVL